MGQISIKGEVKAPVDRIFGFVDDHRNTTRYMKGLTRWSPTTDVVHGKGAEFEVVMKAGPASLRSVVRITGWSENRSIAWRAIEGFAQSGRWAFSPRGDQTTVTLDMEYEFGGGIAGRMLGRAAEPAVRHNLEQSVATLKELTEKLRRAPIKSGPAKPSAVHPAKPKTPGARSAGAASRAGAGSRRPPAR
ncbi:MAG: SRPBCC family protein [Candidatus Dormiibacterota bacterium]